MTTTDKIKRLDAITYHYETAIAQLGSIVAASGLEGQQENDSDLAKVYTAANELRLAAIRYLLEAKR